jgi:rod shape-determining protein MreB
MRRRFDIGIDLGSANVVAVAPGRGVVISAPSVVAVERSTGYAAGWGTGAMAMLLRDPARYHLAATGAWGDSLRRPLALYVLSAVARELCGRKRLAVPRAVLLAPAAPTVLDIRTMFQLASDAGLKPVAIVQSPLAVCMGAGAIDRDTIVTDVGAERVHIATIQMGAVVWSGRERSGMSSVDRDVQRRIREELGIRVGFSEARRAREARNDLRPGERGIRVRGCHVGTCFPTDAEVPDVLIDAAVESLARSVGHSLGAARSRWGCDEVILAGGGALQHMFAAHVAEHAGVGCRLADDPQLAAARGLLYMAECDIPQVTNVAAGV